MMAINVGYLLIIVSDHSYIFFVEMSAQDFWSLFFFTMVNIYSIKFAILIILSEQFCGINYIHTVAQLSSLFPKTFHQPKQKLCKH